MQRFNKKLGLRLSKDQQGFTLVELLVVVAIIVALAAIIVPLVTRFASKGQEGAAAGELDTAQTTIDALMADNLLDAVVASNSNPSLSNDVFSDFAGGGAPAFGNLDPLVPTPPVLLSNYTRDNPLAFWYCWDDQGNVSQTVDADGDPMSVSDFPTQGAVELASGVCNGSDVG